MVNKQAGDRLRFKGLTPSSLGEGGKRLPTLRGECGTALPWGPRCGSSSEKQRGVPAQPGGSFPRLLRERDEHTPTRSFACACEQQFYASQPHTGNTSTLHHLASGQIIISSRDGTLLSSENSELLTRATLYEFLKYRW